MNEIGRFFIAEFLSSWYILDVRPLSDTEFATVPSILLDVLSVLIVFFARQKLQHLT